jgi:hypothetical protein
VCLGAAQPTPLPTPLGSICENHVGQLDDKHQPMEVHSMIKNLRLNRTLWILVACLALIAASIGVFNQDVYSQVVIGKLLPGTISQDAITIVAGLALLILSATTGETDTRKPIIIVSLLAYLFYGYGIYVIERIYNSLYLLYMVIFALSFWSIVYGLVSINRDVARRVSAAKWIGYLSTGSLLFTAVLFCFIWTAQLLPLMQAGERIEYSYSIFILDMVLVMPALVISGILIIRKNALGLIFAPILFFKSFTLLFSVGLGGLFHPLFGRTVPVGETAFYMVLSVIYLALALLCFCKTRFQSTSNGGK